MEQDIAQGEVHSIVPAILRREPPADEKCDYPSADSIVMQMKGDNAEGETPPVEPAIKKRKLREGEEDRTSLDCGMTEEEKRRKSRWRLEEKQEKEALLSPLYTEWKKALDALPPNTVFGVTVAGSEQKIQLKYPRKTSWGMCPSAQFVWMITDGCMMSAPSPERAFAELGFVQHLKRWLKFDSKEKPLATFGGIKTSDGFAFTITFDEVKIDAFMLIVMPESGSLLRVYLSSQVFSLSEPRLVRFCAQWRKASTATIFALPSKIGEKTVGIKYCPYRHFFVTDRSLATLYYAMMYVKHHDEKGVPTAQETAAMDNLLESLESTN